MVHAACWAACVIDSRGISCNLHFLTACWITKIDVKRGCSGYRVDLTVGRSLHTICGLIYHILWIGKYYELYNLRVDSQIFTLHKCTNKYTPDNCQLLCTILIISNLLAKCKMYATRPNPRFGMWFEIYSSLILYTMPLN